MIVRSVTPDEARAWLAMRRDLWPEGTEAQHAADIAAFLEGRAREPLAVLIAEEGRGEPLGFAELSIRPYAEGCDTDRVAYLEGWYVVPAARRRGVGRALVVAAMEWARSQGCTEFGSDAELANEVSAAAHRAVGFHEVGQVRCFKRDL